MHRKDQQATFDDLLARNRGRWAAIARAYAGTDADDLLQEILLQIWRSLTSFEGRSSLDTWCYRVALSTSMMWQRSTQRRKKRIPAQNSDVSVVPAAIDGHDSLQLLEQFLNTLSKSDRALVLLYLDDLSGSDMADVMGISEAAVRVRIHRIKQKLSQWQVGDS
ncbi:MAG: RNA polymerase sigma factor [Planctomycetaceae bacterium]